MKRSSNMWMLAGMTFLLIIGSIWRLYQLAGAPYWMDEGYTINAVLSIEKTGSTILDSGQDYSCAVYCYSTAWISHLFGDTAFSYRLLAAVAGIVFILLFFAIVRQFFSLPVALVSSFFVTFSYWQIAWSRQARWYTLFLIFFWAALYAFYRFLKRQSYARTSLVAAIILTIIAISIHGLGYVLPFFYIGWIIVDAVFIRKDYKRSHMILTVAILILAVAAVTTLSLSIVQSIHLAYVLPYYLAFYLREYWLFILFMTLALAGLVKKYHFEQWYLFSIVLAYLIPLSFLTDIVQYRYLFYVTPVFIVLGSLGMIEVYQRLVRIGQRSRANIFAAVVVIVFFATGAGVLIPKVQYFLESDTPQNSGIKSYYAYTPQPDWNAAYAFVGAHRTATDLIVSTQPQFTKIFLDQAGYWIKYDYLGITNAPSTIVDDKEYYVGAEVIDDLADLKTTLNGHHGFIIFDYMAVDRIPKEIIDFIQTKYTQVFHEQTQEFSQVWVYQF